MEEILNINTGWTLSIILYMIGSCMALMSLQSKCNRLENEIKKLKDKS